MLQAAYRKYAGFSEHNKELMEAGAYEKEFERLRVIEEQLGTRGIQHALMWSFSGRGTSTWIGFGLADCPFYFRIFFGGDWDDPIEANPARVDVAVYDRQIADLFFEKKAEENMPNNGHYGLLNFFDPGPSFGESVTTLRMDTLAGLLMPTQELQGIVAEGAYAKTLKKGRMRATKSSSPVCEIL